MNDTNKEKNFIYEHKEPHIVHTIVKVLINLVGIGLLIIFASIFFLAYGLKNSFPDPNPVHRIYFYDRYSRELERINDFSLAGLLWFSDVGHTLSRTGGSWLTDETIIIKDDVTNKTASFSTLVYLDYFETRIDADFFFNVNEEIYPIGNGLIGVKLNLLFPIEVKSIDEYEKNYDKILDDTGFLEGYELLLDSLIARNKNIEKVIPIKDITLIKSEIYMVDDVFYQDSLTYNTEYYYDSDEKQSYLKANILINCNRVFEEDLSETFIEEFFIKRQEELETRIEVHNLDYGYRMDIENFNLKPFINDTNDIFFENFGDVHYRNEDNTLHYGFKTIPHFQEFIVIYDITNNEILSTIVTNDLTKPITDEMFISLSKELMNHYEIAMSQ